ncbi:MAG: YtxH domain-containing protein [Bacteroidota bacterium]
MRSGKILLGVLAGLAVGASMGILFAPARGSSTRRKISRKSDEYADELGEKFNEFAESIKDKFEKIRKDANAMAKSGKHLAEDVKAEL